MFDDFLKSELLWSKSRMELNNNWDSKKAITYRLAPQ